MTAQPKKIVFITGANTGLGFEIAKALFSRTGPYHILVGCRGDVGRAKDAIARLNETAARSSSSSSSSAEPVSIDISSDESISAAYEHIRQRFGYIDVLVNNAGADFDSDVKAGRLSKRQGWNQTWDVNVTGTHIVTEVFAPLLLASSSSSSNKQLERGPGRILFITSGISSLDEHSSGASPHFSIGPAGWPKPSTNFLAYRCSKTGMNMLATEWARVLRADGIHVFAVSPGFLNTGLGDDRVDPARSRDKSLLGAIDPAVGGAYCADVVDGKRDDSAWPIKVQRENMVQPW